ncbi:hypothetical protein ACH4E7_23575 [Kitasatospora sp. NPDC018058]|uniref:hypothetical protein n=1 Tax=Kitasatospora sp. NPDC018058 TaxID=3364025 RepID=UPI0037C18371
MTTDPDTPELLARIDDLLARERPYPQKEVVDGEGYGGPGYRVLELDVSGDFWDDEDGQACERAHDEADARLEALAAVLTARWGEPYDVDLWSYLVAGYGWDHPGRPSPVPLGLLSGKAVTLRVWPLPGAGARWLGLAVGQEDKELPVVLLAALADGPAPAPCAPPAGRRAL